MREGRRSSAGTSHSLGDIGHFSGYGLGWALTVALLAWAGLKLDEWLGTSPLMILLCTLGGIAAGMVTVYMRAMAGAARSDSDLSNGGGEHR